MKGEMVQNFMFLSIEQPLAYYELMVDVVSSEYRHEILNDEIFLVQLSEILHQWKFPAIYDGSRLEEHDI